MIGIPASGWRSHWFPLCALEDLPPRHVLETQLLGTELAVWRGEGGRINVWANRCPHRGMRLSVGANFGSALRCAYHGYRFENGSGRCELLPAHPDRKPPQSLAVRVFESREQFGLVWTRLETGPEVAIEATVADEEGVALYPIAVNAPAAAIASDLHAEGLDAVRRLDEFSWGWRGALLFLQPVDANSSVIHGRVSVRDLEGQQCMAVLREYADELTRLRSRIEGAYARLA